MKIKCVVVPRTVKLLDQSDLLSRHEQTIRDPPARLGCPYQSSTLLGETLVLNFCSNRPVNKCSVSSTSR
jgi:hypothetical protein